MAKGFCPKGSGLLEKLRIAKRVIILGEGQVWKVQTLDFRELPNVPK
jgi:hypothetical protein